MSKVILQIPMDQNLRIEAEKSALKQGFSSLQEYIRVNLTKLANDQIEITFKEPDVYLSPQSQARYGKIDQDFRTKKNISTANSLEELERQLDESI